MRSPGLARGAVALMIGAMVVAIAWQGRTGRRLGAELGSLRRQQAELVGLRAENEKLALRTTAAGEQDRLQDAQAEIARLRAELAEVKRKPAPRPVPVSLPSDEWKLAGRATPRAAFESVLWAANHQEIDRLAGLLNFDTKTRTQMDTFFAKLPEETRAQYGSPEKIVATMMAANMPADVSAISELGSATGPDETTVLMRIQRNDGTQKTTYFKFQRATDGWQMTVPLNILHDYERELTNTSVPVAEALANGQKP
jgi:hypothetical protein